MTLDSEYRVLEETLSRLFDKNSGPEDRQRARTAGWSPECWDPLSELGLSWVGVPETAGGSGGGVLDACVLVRSAGRHAVALPLAECTLLGGWLVAEAGLQLPSTGALTVPLPRRGDSLTIDDRGRVSGTLSRVPWGERAATVVAIAEGSTGDRVVMIDPFLAAVRRGRNVADEPRDALSLDAVPVPSDRLGPPRPQLRTELHLRGALSRSVLMAGAIEAVAAMTVGYASDRRQFGRPIAAFQAVANRLVRLSAEGEAAILAAHVAAHHFAGSGSDAAFAVAMARTTVCRAASEVITHAHQIHGAIGMTQEYPLHDFTRRLLAWRQEWGGERHWANVAGEELAASHGAPIWPRLTADQPTHEQ